MQRKILALAAVVALGAAMTTGAMAAHVGGGGGGGGGHGMSMGGARMGTFAAVPRGNFAAVPRGNFAGPRTTFARPGVTGNRFAGWGNGRFHRRRFFGGPFFGLYAYSGYPYDCYNWPYNYGYPYNNCYAYGYGY